ncbi:uncharacterized protein OCT59_009597 [Rhizophagus irregularis]|uniref:uncharacterized protein n=1 Tax=Rhizophagus irregularis TaxID=588596 RepID=UPI0033300C88|nr:hypothetical protein OCT59_009597 [Rhizophagus irregularis]
MPSAVFVLCQIKSKGLDGGFVIALISGKCIFDNEDMYTALQFFGRGIWQVFFRISGREIDIFWGILGESIF